jgi:glycosyltransferase involved in cell wall biosynthesis
MASGLPIIAVKAGALVELVKDKLNGYLYNEGDLSALVQYIENILTNDVLYKEMSKKSLELVQEHDINNTLRSFEKVYRDYTDNNLDSKPSLGVLSVVAKTDKQSK